MITNFPEETKPLTKYERETLLPLFLNGLENKIGIKNAITSTKMKKGFWVECKIKMSGARVRKMINHIRIKNLIPCLVGTSKGYWISRIDSEVELYIKSLRGREDAIHRVRIALEFQLVNKQKGIKDYLLKDNVRSWFYYHHRTTNPIKPKHFIYIECLNWLISETNIIPFDYKEPSFAQIRVAINELSKEQMLKIYTLQRKET